MNADLNPECEVSVKLAVNLGGRAFSPNPKCCKDLFVMLLEGTSGYTRTDLQAHAAKVYCIMMRNAFNEANSSIASNKINECCLSPLNIDPRPCCPLIQQMEHLLGQCFMAGAENVLVYTYSFWEIRNSDGSIQRYYYDPISKPQEYFQYSSSSLFEVKLLNDITNNNCV